VVIDPGHGGKDTGATITLDNGSEVFEADYVWDVALRLENLLLQKGALPFLTTERINGQQTFAGDTTLVEGTDEGLHRRTTYGNQLREMLPEYRLVLISIHFDSLPGYPWVAGVRIIRTVEGGKLAQALKRSFAKRCHLRKSAPVVFNGDKRGHGLRNLIVPAMCDYYVIPSAFVELGNSKNKSDVRLIAAPEERENFARAFVEALESMK
jgi:N-acetylmuramoyl-L-alanine amidase